MRISKKFFAVILACMILLSSICVLAEETAEERKVYDVETVNLGDYIKDTKKWEGPEGLDLTFKNGKIINENDELVVFSYTEDSFADNLVQYDVNFKYTGADGKSAWSGLALRSSITNDKTWNAYSGAYLFVIKSDRIELQRWGGGQVILDVVENKYIKDGVDASISVGAVNTDEGVCIVLFVDGVCVMNVCDDDKGAVTEGKYFNVYASAGSSISAYTGDAVPSVPTAPVVTADTENGYKLKTDYSLISFGEETEDAYKITWRHSVKKVGTELTEIDESAIKEFSNNYECVGVYPDYLGEGNEIEAEAQYATDFYLACIVDAEDNIVTHSKPVYIEEEPFLVNAANEIYKSSVILMVDYETAIVNGEVVQIDENDVDVIPTVIDGRTLVPVRFVAESFGAKVGWEDATQEVTIELDGNTIVMTLDETTYTVNGEEKQLDVAARTIQDRTMVPVRAISEAFGKFVFWDEENELIVISNENLGLDSVEDEDVLYYIAREIK
ncbi:MAG: copper amine oxidase N-terminal domain-containing protein [Clostridia bacterium]|nr:copper amine oxidase N-terminal domain-containing protein [Clostridia bacterium]